MNFVSRTFTRSKTLEIAKQKIETKERITRIKEQKNATLVILQDEAMGIKQQLTLLTNAIETCTIYQIVRDGTIVLVQIAKQAHKILMKSLVYDKKLLFYEQGTKNFSVY